MLEGLEPSKRTYTCPVVRLRESLDDADKAILDAAIADTEKFTPNALMTALQKKGVTLYARAIRLHRQKECQCSKA